MFDWLKCVIGRSMSVKADDMHSVHRTIQLFRLRRRIHLDTAYVVGGKRGTVDSGLWAADNDGGHAN